MTRKQPLRVVLAAALWAALLASWSCSSSLRRIPVDEFLLLVERGPESTFSSHYVGYSRGAHESKARVYLETWRTGSSSTRTEICWAPLSEFPAEYVPAILSGQDPFSAHDEKDQNMELGAFSNSLAVKDLEASRSFYEKLGFQVVGGDASQNWLILRNQEHTIGLFQGMFEKNLMTFNPGWDGKAQPLDSFTDVRVLQRRLKEQGVSLATEADETTNGPASFVVVDPDGNQLLFDQHVNAPGN